MQLIPAIDLLKGNAVRLFKGDMEKVTVYSNNPVDLAKRFIDMGVTRVHIVDLDGARDGSCENFKIIEQIAKLDALKIDVGGGIRDITQARDYFNAGVSYAVLGTAIVKNPSSAIEILSAYPKMIILGIDARNGRVATDGWNKDSAIDAVTLIKRYSDYDIEGIIYTDINKDGTLTGFNTEELKNVAENSPFGIIASGGMSSSEDIKKIENINNIKGCIIGKAFYENKIDLAAEILKQNDRNS